MKHSLAFSLPVHKFWRSFVCICMWIILLGAVVAPQSLYAQCITPPSGMVAWWPLDEQAGATIVEDIVGSHDGTPSPGPIGIVGSNDGPWTCGGKVGDALWFWQNGVYRRYVSVASQPDIEFASTDFSIDAWVYITQYSGTDLQPIVEKMQYSGTTPELGYRFYLESGTLSFVLAWGLGTATTIQAPSQISQGVWHHVAVTVHRDPGGATVTLYIDGTPIPSTNIPTLTTQSIAHTEALIMGAIAQPQPPPVNYLNIYIDELEMFNRELLQSEVQSIYDADSFGKCKPSCIPPPANMTAWWPLDETSGPTANDIAGYANNGTWMNSPTPVTGKVAGALSFDGSNSVDVPDHQELNFGTGDFSIDFWIKTTDASGTRTILDKRTGSLPNVTGCALYLWNGKPGLGLGDGAGYNNWTSTGFVADGIWHHVAATVDRDNSSGLLFYVDGSHVSTFDPTPRSGDLTNTAPFVMARNLIDPGYTFAGTLDEVELFNRALDSLEVYSIWNADSLGKCKDTCHADGDANNDAVGLTPADLVYLDDFINACGPAPIPLYSCDLNGDGLINAADLQLYQDYFVYGISVFDPYGGYPVPCPCNPIAEVEGPPTLICHFMTPDKAPHPFDVTTSHGEQVDMFNQVTYIETEVPLTFTMTLLYCVDQHCEFWEFPLTFSPCDTVELEFYAVDPNTVQSRVRPYLAGKEVGTEVTLDWDYDADSNTLSYSVVTEPLDRYAFVNTWVNTFNKVKYESYVFRFRVNGVEYEFEYCTNGTDFIIDPDGNVISWKSTSQIAPSGPNPDDTSEVQYVFTGALEGTTPVGVQKVWDDFARIEPYTLSLKEQGGPSYEPQYYFPQFAVSPGASYTLKLAGMPQEYVGLKFPLTVPDSLGNIILDLTPPRVEDLQPYSFSIGGGGFALWSSYSDFAYFPDDSLTVNVATGIPYCDSWGCFVLPDSQTAQQVYAYSEDKGVDTLVSGADWLDNPTGEYNIVTVRIAPGVSGLTLIPGPAFIRGDANGDGVINGSDIVYLLNYLYRGGDPPDPEEAGDTNCDGVVNGSDIVYLLNYLYRGGDPPGC